MANQKVAAGTGKRAEDGLGTLTVSCGFVSPLPLHHPAAPAPRLQALGLLGAGLPASLCPNPGPRSPSATMAGLGAAGCRPPYVFMSLIQGVGLLATMGITIFNHRLGHRDCAILKGKVDVIRNLKTYNYGTHQTTGNPRTPVPNWRKHVDSEEFYNPPWKGQISPGIRIAAAISPTCRSRRGTQKSRTLRPPRDPSMHLLKVNFRKNINEFLILISFLEKLGTLNKDVQPHIRERFCLYHFLAS
ncbi:hypothetical protein QTO34_000474, partial [Cnephaeus nilssonii]